MSNLRPSHNWVQIHSLILAVLTFPLIWIGGLVTTYDAGMTVPDWPTTYGYNMFLYPLSTWLNAPWGLFIEHKHRLLASLVGLQTIILLVVLWRDDRFRHLRWFAVLLLAMVIFQGLLGGMRVRFDSRTIARVHGCTGPLFFSLVGITCVMTGYTNRSLRSGIARETFRHALAGWFFFATVFAQMVLGAHLRHPSIDWQPSVFRLVTLMHVIVAFLLLTNAWYLARRYRKLSGPVRYRAFAVGIMVTMQVLLGLLTWRAKYGWPTFLPLPIEAMSLIQSEALRDWLLPLVANFAVVADGFWEGLIITSHVAVGSLILFLAAGMATHLTIEAGGLFAYRKTLLANGRWLEHRGVTS